jgi:hypothetical protein
VSVRPSHLGALVAVAVAAGVVTWAVVEVVAGTNPTRLRDIVACVVAAAAGGAIVLGAYRLLHLPAVLTTRGSP